MSFVRQKEDLNTQLTLQIKIGMGHTLMLLLLTKANLYLKITKSLRITGITKLITYILGKKDKQTKDFNISIFTKLN
jgi:hypothetical protein